MKIKIIVSSIILIVAIGVAGYLKFNQPNSLLSEAEALDLLTDTIVRDSLYDSFTTLQCLDFYTNEIKEEYFVFTIREIHGNGCEGDPNTHPRVDTFKVMRRSKNIFYEDWKGGSYLQYDHSKLKR